MLDFLKNLDRRWIFLAMLLAVAIPVVMQKTFPEKPTKLVQDAFNAIDNLPDESNVLFSFDYEPSTEGELAPMARALIRHCCLKRHKMFFMTLWPGGLPLIEQNIEDIILKEYYEAHFEKGINYLNLGYNAGREVTIIVMGTNFKRMFPTGNDKVPLDDPSLPMAHDIDRLDDMDLIVDISAGYPGMKEWVQYGASPYGMKLVIASTAVQAPQAYPYYPNQLTGVLAAIKGAAEYEAALGEKYPKYRDPKFNDAIRRMAPQLWAHLLIIGLILLGNGIYFAERMKGTRR